MAKLSIVAGATSQSVNLFIQDSGSTTGTGKTGLAFNTSGLTAYYTFAGANATATSITLATLAAVNSAYSSGGFKEIDSTNMPGWYRFDIPNAAIATSKGRSVGIHFQGASGMAPLPLEIELTGWDNQDAVHGGMSALPNTAVTTNGSLITSGTGSDQLQVASGIASADAKKINAVSTSSVTTVNANQGTTQPVNFTGTGASALPKVDTIDIASVAAVLDANNLLKVDTEDFGGAAGTFTSGRPAVQSVTGAVGSVTGNVGGNLVGSIGAVGTGAIVQASFAANAINSAAVDSSTNSAIAAATVASSCTEPTAVVGKNPTLIQALSWLLTMSRNLITQTATTQTLKADDGTTTIASSTVSDDGTVFSRAKFS